MRGSSLWISGAGASQREDPRIQAQALALDQRCGGEPAGETRVARRELVAGGKRRPRLAPDQQGVTALLLAHAAEIERPWRHTGEPHAKLRRRVVREELPRREYGGRDHLAGTRRQAGADQAGGVPVPKVGVGELG